MDDNLIKKIIINNIEEGIIIFDTALNIVYSNDRCREKLGIADDANIIGESLFSVFSTVTVNDSHIIKVIKTGEPLIGYYDEFITKYGRKVNLFNSTFPIRENGVVIGVIDIYREINGYDEMKNRIKILESMESKCKRMKFMNTNYENNNGTIYTIDNFIGRSEAVRNLKERIRKVSCSDSSVLIYGETGTGKEIIAQSLHNLSGTRSKFPFIAQNCAALPFTLLESIFFGVEKGSYTDAENRPGLFELANNGTLFLDEVNSMEMKLQGKMLRVLEDGIIRRLGSGKVKQVDTRIIASTNENPGLLLERKKIRQDLFYRLNTIYLEVPPLRKRKEDIEELVFYFIKLYNNKYNKEIKKFSNEVMDMFMSYNWPGNVRELQNIIEYSVGIIKNCSVIDVEYLSDSVVNKFLSVSNSEKPCAGDLFSKSLKANLISYEIKLIKEKLVETNGNVSLSAKLLNIPKQTLFSKIRKYNIKWDINMK